MSQTSLVSLNANTEEITPERAKRVYQQLYRAIYGHMAVCSDCERYAKIGMDMPCIEQKGLWRALRWWGKQMDNEAEERAS
jgi:hypothetical protein